MGALYQSDPNKRVSFMWPGNHPLQVHSTLDGLSQREGFEKDKNSLFPSALQGPLFIKLNLESC